MTIKTQAQDTLYSHPPRRYNPQSGRPQEGPMSIKPFHLIWHYDGAMRGQRFADWDDCMALSKMLIAAGMVPKLTDDSPCPYDGLETNITPLVVDLPGVT